MLVRRDFDARSGDEYGRADDGVLIEAERVVGGGAAVVTPSPSPAPY